MEVEEPSRISFWDSHQSDPDAICDPKKIRAINYKMAIIITILAAITFAAGATLHWSDVVEVEKALVEVKYYIYPSGYGFVLLAAGSAVMGFLMGMLWKRPYLAIPLIWIVGVPGVLFGNWYAGQIFEGEFVYTFQWRTFQDICLGPFIASVASLVSLSMYRFD
jgi:hypothetical protein